MNTPEMSEAELRAWADALVEPPMCEFDGFVACDSTPGGKDAIKMIREVKALAPKAGGYEQLQGLVDAIADGANTSERNTSTTSVP